MKQKANKMTFGVRTSASYEIQTSTSNSAKNDIGSNEKCRLKDGSFFLQKCLSTSSTQNLERCNSIKLFLFFNVGTRKVVL